MSEDRWPPPPDCPTCRAKDSTEIFRRHKNGTAWIYCRCCAKTYLVDQYGTVLRRADEVRG